MVSTTMQKLISLTIHTAIFFFVLLPFIVLAHEHAKEESIHRSNKQNIHELTPRLSYEIRLHGFVLWASMGFLMPIGILVVRMSNRQECGRRLKIIVYIHAILQILSVLLATIGAIMSIRSFENTFNNNHQRIGLALYVAIWLQAITAVLRPGRGSKRRSVWFSVHWLFGTAVALLGIINIYTGLKAYHDKTLTSIRVWNLVFTVEIAVMVLIYLLQEKWDYIMKTRAILGNEAVQPTDQESSPGDEKKEISAVPSADPC